MAGDDCFGMVVDMALARLGSKVMDRTVIMGNNRVRL